MPIYLFAQLSYVPLNANGAQMHFLYDIASLFSVVWNSSDVSRGVGRDCTTTGVGFYDLRASLPISMASFAAGRSGKA